MLIDSLLNMVIGFSDTIIGLSDDERCDKGDQIIPYTEGKASVFFYYQSVRENQTLVFDNGGKPVFAVPFEGLLMHQDLVNPCTDEKNPGQNPPGYLYTESIWRRHEEMKHGLISNTGQTIIPLGPYHIFKRYGEAVPEFSPQR